MLLVSVSFICPVQALEVYSSLYNSYYQRGQHTYSWHEGYRSHSNTAPAAYILYKDQSDAENEEEWVFTDKYPLVYDAQKDNNYYIALCADLITLFRKDRTYNVVSLDDSTFIKEDVKKYLAGVIKNTYPFITVDDMTQRMLNAGYLVEYTTEDGQKYYTAKENADEQSVTRSIHMDELLAAAQAAVYYYTDPGKVDDYYYRTVGKLSSSYSVVITEHAYEDDDNYDEVQNNIDAAYNYLISLSSKYIETAKIENVVANHNNELFILTNDIKDISSLSFVVRENDEVIAEKKLSDLQKNSDNYYVLPLDNVQDISKVKVSVSGNVYIENEVLVFEANDGYYDSQTLIGLGTSEVGVNKVYEEDMQILDNNSITLTKEVDNDFLMPGEAINFTIKVKNETNQVLKDIVLKDQVLAELEILDTDGGFVKDGYIVWNLGFEPYEEKVINIKANVKKKIDDVNLTNTVGIKMYNIDKVSSVNFTVKNNPNTGYYALSIIPIGILIGMGVVIIKKSKNKNVIHKI